MRSLRSCLYFLSRSLGLKIYLVLQFPLLDYDELIYIIYCPSLILLFALLWLLFLFYICYFIVLSLRGYLFLLNCVNKVYLLQYFNGNNLYNMLFFLY